MLARLISIAIPSLLLLGCGPPAVPDSEGDGEASTVTIDGRELHVSWNDGDSFRVVDENDERHRVRLTGYNTLENHGPVHRWGTWTPAGLHRVSVEATAAAAAGSWSCATKGSLDRYGRQLVTCDDLILSMVSRGLGHLYLIDDVATAEQLAAQRSAQERGLGMWAHGVPELIVTSVHSAAEGEDGSRVYNRVISTVDGSSEQVPHTDSYTVCEEVCLRGSCMVYVPYEQRWGDRKAECLRN